MIPWGFWWICSGKNRSLVRRKNTFSQERPENRHARRKNQGNSKKCTSFSTRSKRIWKFLKLFLEVYGWKCHWQLSKNTVRYSCKNRIIRNHFQRYEKKRIRLCRTNGYIRLYASRLNGQWSCRRLFCEEKIISLQNLRKYIQYWNGVISGFYFQIWFLCMLFGRRWRLPQTPPTTTNANNRIAKGLAAFKNAVKAPTLAVA